MIKRSQSLRWLVMAARVTQAALIGVVLGRIFRGDGFASVTRLLVLTAVIVVVRGVLGVRGREHWESYTELGAEYLDSMQGMTTLKSLNAALARRGLLTAKAVHLFRTTMRQMAVSMIDTGLTTFGVQLGVAVAVGIGAVRVAEGQLDVITLLVLLVLTGECFRPFGELSAYWHAGFLGVPAAEGIADLLAPAPAPDAADARPLPADAAPSVTFEEVSFAYPGRITPAVRGLTLSGRCSRTPRSSSHEPDRRAGHPGVGHRDAR